MKVYVLLFHDVWNLGGDPGEENENGEPEETSIEGVFATHEAAQAAQTSIGDLDPKHAFHTIEEYDLNTSSFMVEQVRRLQHAANMLSYTQFLQATGWERDDYSKDKWNEFRRLGGMHTFDSHTLKTLVAFYEAQFHASN
jgi:hypothetical protein